MLRDGGVPSWLREVSARPVTPLRGVAILVCAAVAGALFLDLLNGAPSGPVPPPPQVSDEPVVVHVAGLVQRPGLYRLPGGARVADALTAAGGPAEGADLSTLNLARVVEDGEQLLVVGPRPEGGGAGAGGVRPDGKLDLNRAGAAELDTLPGIGPVLAARIVDYRERQGGFRTVRDLRRVQGIGEKLYQSLVELVTV